MLRNCVQWKSELKHHEKVSRSGLCVELVACGAELWNCGNEICKNRLDGSAVYPVCVKTTRQSIVRRQSEM